MTLCLYLLFMNSENNKIGFCIFNDQALVLVKRNIQVYKLFVGNPRFSEQFLKLVVLYNSGHI